jgi:hypothetical protein
VGYHSNDINLALGNNPINDVKTGESAYTAQH